MMTGLVGTGGVLGNRPRGGALCRRGGAVNGAAIRHALVTGASSGIGRGLALALARRGAHVVAAARRRERLDELVREIVAAGGRAEALVLDVADADATFAAVRAVDARLPLDFVVANAGIGRHHAGQEARLDARQVDPRDQPRRRGGDHQRRRARHGRARRRTRRRRRQRRRLSRAAALRRLFGVEGRAHHAVRELAHRFPRHRRVGHHGLPGVRADRAPDAGQVASVRRLRRRRGGHDLESAADARDAVCTFPAPIVAGMRAAQLLPRSLYEFVATRSKVKY